MSGVPKSTRKRRHLGMTRRYVLPAGPCNCSDRVLGGDIASLAAETTLSTPPVVCSTRLKIPNKTNKVDKREKTESEKLETQICELEAQKSRLQLAVKYRAQEAKLLLSEHKWRNIAQMAAEELLEEALLRINRMGGAEEYWRARREARRRQREWKVDEMLFEKLEEFKRTGEYGEMSSSAKGELESRMAGKMGIQAVCEEKEDEPHEFDMKELFGQLGIDYGRVFGE